MLKARVVVTDLDGVDHTIMPTTLGPSEVMKVSFAHKAADDFAFKIEDSDGTIGTWLKRGCIAKIYIDTTALPTTLKLNAMVEEVVSLQPMSQIAILSISGRETFHVIINNRIVTETYLDYEVSLIIRDLLKKYAPYPDETVLAMSFYEGEGLIVHDESKYLNHGTINGWLAGWKYRIPLAFDKGKIDGDLTNFPVLIHLSSSSGIGGVDATCVFDEIGANYLKIAVRYRTGAECYVEVEKWDAVNKEAWLWVKVPLVRASANYSTGLCLYYDADHADNTARVGLPNSAVAENVWDANFKIVSHMQDDPDTSHIRDSTTNDNDGNKTAANEPIEVVGEIAEAQDFDNLNDFISIADNAGLDGLLTFEAWVDPVAEQASGTFYHIIASKHADYRHGLIIRYDVSPNRLVAHFYDGVDVSIAEWAIPDYDAVYHVMAVFDATVAKLYVNGDLKNTGAVITGHTGDNAEPVRLGGGVVNRYSRVILDEFRASDVVRPAEYAKASYESGRDNLITFGEQEGEDGPWVDGIYGKALSFRSGSVVIPDAPSLNPTDEITVSVWIKINDYDPNGGPARIIAKGQNEAYQIWIKNNQVRFVIGPNYNVGPLYTGLNLHQWYHIVGTYDGNIAKIYVDGDYKDTHTYGTPIPTTSDALIIGDWTPTPQRPYNGIVDEPLIITRCLNADEVKALYNYPYLHDIDVTATTLEDIRFPYRPMRECLEELVSLSGYGYLGNPNSIMLWKEEASEDSGFTYTETEIQATPEVIESLLPIKNRVYVIGGNYMQVDQQQLVHDASKNVWEKWRAQSFTPDRSDLDQISLYLDRTGAPENLEGEIRTDDAGDPGEILATFNIDADFIGTTATWRPTAVEAQLLIGVKYWIVIKKTGDGANHYKWYDDDAAAGENAESDDGVTWVVNNGGSYQFAFKTHYVIPILAVSSDYAHKDIYKWREIVIEDKSIMTRGLARETADAKLENLKDMTAELRDINIIDPVGIPELGKLVTISLPRLGLNAAQYVAKVADLRFNGGTLGTYLMPLKLGKEASELAEWLRDLKSEVDRTKVGAFGVERGLINLVRDLSDTAEATDDNLVATVQLSGTFLIDTARIDFSDIA